MRRRVPPLLLAVLAALGACRSRPTAAECMQMLDRYVDMRAAGDPSLAGVPEAQAAEIRDAMRSAKRREPAYDRARAQCEEEVSRKEYECAMKAPTPNDWEACIE